MEKKMIRINKENKVIEIRLNKEIYPYEKIIKTCKDFLEMFYIAINEDNKYYIVYMKPKEKLSEEELEEMAWLYPTYLLASLKE